MARSGRPRVSIDRANQSRIGADVDILLCEDNPTNTLVFSEMLRAAGYFFATVCDGQQGVDAFWALRPRLVLMDIAMPVVNGIKATSTIRAREKRTGEQLVPIIAVTACAMREGRTECLEAGMNDFLSKPVSFKALVDAINCWIGAPENEFRDKSQTSTSSANRAFS